MLHNFINRRVLRYLTLLPAMVVVTFLLMIPLPVDQMARRWPALIADLENSAHPVVFAWLAWLGFHALRRRFPSWRVLTYVLTFVITVAFGLATEAVQAMVGRDSAWIDLANDALGALFALLLIARSERLERRGSAGPFVLTALAAAVAFVAMAPLGRTVAAYGWRATQAPVLWEPESRMLQRFSTWFSGAQPVLELREVPFDAQGYDAIEIDIRNLDKRPLQMLVILRDRLHPFPTAAISATPVLLQPLESRVLRITQDEIRAAYKGSVIEPPTLGRVVLVQETVAERPLFRVDELRLAR